MLMMQGFYTGPLDVNCYVVYDDQTKNGFMVDPGGVSKTLTSFIETQHIKIKMIFLTHGHGDHIGGAREYREKYQAPIYAHKEEGIVLGSAMYNSSAMMFGYPVELQADVYVTDGQEIPFEGHTIKILHTPGHSPGGICILIEKWLFCGDTLFAGSVGRTDFPLCSTKDLFDGIRNKLFTLDPDTMVFPGHGPSTTIGFEKEHNPFF